MSLLVWVMMGIALWHFTVFLPDHFWGGMVGAFFIAVLGSALFGFLVSGLTIPGSDDTGLLEAFVSIPGTVLALAGSYFYGLKRDREEGIERLPI